MSGPVLLTDLARDALSGWLTLYLPGQIDRVNLARPDKHTLQPIQTWTASPLVATPEPPAVGILPQTSGFRGTQWPAALDETHALLIYVQAANQDEEALEQDLIGYAAAVVNCLLLWVKGEAPLEGGVQFEFGTKNSEDLIIFGPKLPAAGILYGDVTLPLTVLLSETP